MSKTKQPAAPASSDQRTTTKKDQLLALLRRPGGASLNDMTAATGWLPHTARAMLTGFRKKGFSLTKDKVDGETRYSITAEPSA
jgi:DNA-binding IclR family transcriptional regulator